MSAANSFDYEFFFKSGALDQIKDIIIAVNNHDKIIYLNKAAAQQYNVDKNEVVDLKLSSLYKQLWFNPEDEHKASLSLKEKGYWEGVNIRQQPDGSKMVVESAINVIKDKAGNKIGLLSITRDITNRVDIVNWLFESNQRLSYVIEAADMMIYEIDLKTKQILIIRGLEELLGYSVGEVPSTVDWWISQIHPDDKLKAQEQFYPTKLADRIVNEYRIRAKGGYIFVQGAAKVLTDKAGNPARIIGSMQNITMQKDLEKQLQEKDRLSAIGETAGMVGHDLRNPLQSIIGEVYLAKNELKLLPESQAKANLQESIHTIYDQIGYMDKIVSDLQTFVKPVEPLMQVVKLKPLILALIAQQVIPSNIQTTIQVADRLSVEADPQLLKRVLINLVTNAVQAMPQGGELTLTAQTKEKQVQMIVKDTGTGIAEEIKPKLFIPLFTTKSKGQGFGLAACKRVIEAMGGTISFDSQVGKGTKFVVSLPA